MGVTSSMRPILRPERDRARSADWAPGPGVFVLLPPVARSLMCSAVMPSSCSERGESSRQRCMKSRHSRRAAQPRATRLALQGNVLGSKHSGVGRGLVAVGLHLHAACRSEARRARASDVRCCSKLGGFAACAAAPRRRNAPAGASPAPARPVARFALRARGKQARPGLWAWISERTGHADERLLARQVSDVPEARGRDARASATARGTHRRGAADPTSTLTLAQRRAA